MRSLSTPACTEQTTCRGAAFASRLDHLAFRGDKRGRSKALIFAVLNGASITDPEPVMISQPRELGLRTKDLRDNRKSHHLRPHQIPRSHCTCTIARVASCTRRARLLQTSHDASFCAVAQRQSCGDVHKMTHCRLACISPPSSPDPKLAPESFALAKNESSDRFIGDIRPLNGREKSSERAHLPYCPRLRRMIMEKPETVQITIRNTTDSFYLCESSSFTRGDTDDWSSRPPEMYRSLWVPADCDKRACHAKCQRRLHSRMCSPPTIARCPQRMIFVGQWARGAPMSSVISSICLQTRVSQVVRSRKNLGRK